MTDLNVEWALGKLREFRKIAAVHFVPETAWELAYWESASPSADVQAAAQVAEQILDRVLPGWRDADWDGDSGPNWRHRAATVRAIAQLEAQEELEANLGPVGPKLAAASLHPWVWGSVASLWGSGHYREAVGLASRAVNAQAQAKLDRRDESEATLIGQAFSLKPPTPGRPRLRLMEDDGSDTYRSLHDGAGALARGLYGAVRNPISHEYDEAELDEDEALESLAAFSILARWIDRATLEHHG